MFGCVCTVCVCVCLCRTIHFLEEPDTGELFVCRAQYSTVNVAQPTADLLYIHI